LEKHAAAAKTAELKNQLLEIRVAKTYVSELGKIKASQPPQETEFEFSSAKSRA
jgi:HSP20 family molecular chaperone IbpA